MTGRVLVTGASGLIGRQTVAPLIGMGLEVVTVSRSGSPVEGAEVLAGDLLDPIDRRSVIRQARASHLVHLAWHDAAKGRWTEPANLDWAAATISLVRDFAAVGGRHAVVAGSCAEYDWSRRLLSESTPLAPATTYGAAKARTGQLLTAASRDLGISLAWARIFFCYGPGEPAGRLVGDLVRGLSAGRAVDCTDGQQIRDFMFAGDVGRALAMVLGAAVDGPINICSGTGTQVASLIDTAAGIAGRPDLIRLGALARPPHDPTELVGTCDRLAGIGFSPEYTLERGLRACLTSGADRS